LSCSSSRKISIQFQTKDRAKLGRYNSGFLLQGQLCTGAAGELYLLSRQEGKMLWWQKSQELIGHVNEALMHINAARDESVSSSATKICELYFHALNKLWNAHAQHSCEPARADTPAFIALLKELAVGHDDLLSDSRLEGLVALTPQVLNHSTLKSAGYRPAQVLDDRLRRDATEEHRKLQNAYSRWVQDKADTAGVLKKLAEFLYVIRSNIAHGEKTPYGPDLEKIRRDEMVSKATFPLLELIIDRLFASPSCRLVSYGTLKPGGENASVLADIPGRWTACRIRGRIQQTDGLPSLRWDPRAEEIEAMVLESPSLNDRWMDLDRFEGRRYQRRLVSIMADQLLWIANCYEANSWPEPD
jgi:gamma-glutamylcyclotransferase (GGCT)/AIG2-like uncharacterized protein YtfP